MRIAISVETNAGLKSTVSHHFGRCPYFVFVDVDGEEVSNVEVIENPYYAHHQPGMVPGLIHGKGADVMISGGMGRRALGFFQDMGIQTATGGFGTVEETLTRYLGGDLTVSEPCAESKRHEHDRHSNGDCGHHH